MSVPNVPEGFLSSIGLDHVIDWVRTSISKSFRVPSKQIPRVFFHGLILGVVISGFWLLDSLKDPIFSQTVGIEYQPIAKLLSVVTTLAVVCVYDFLTTIVSKANLFHVVSVFFGTLMIVIAALLTNPDIGLPNRSKGPYRMLGWVSYFAIEAYGSLMVALFWSFTNSLMNLEEAKGAYGLIISIAQVGAISGSTLATHSKDVGMDVLFLIGGLCIYSVSFLIKVYYISFRAEAKSILMAVSSNDEGGTPSSSRYGSPFHSPTTDHKEYITPFTDASSMHIEESNSDQPQKKHVQKETKQPLDTLDETSADTSLLSSNIELAKTAHQQNSVEKAGAGFIQSLCNIFAGFYEGLNLIVKHGYMTRVLGVSCLYEVVVTVLDYEFKLLGNSSAENVVKKKYMENIVHGDPEMLLESFGAESGDYFAVLLGHFGQFTNIISFLVSFFGFSYIVDKLGVKKTLLIFPITLLITVVFVHLVPTLWVFFVLVSIIKAMIFSLQDPTKELLYMPTSEPIKFKAKAWIDVFGSRFAKALGSMITNWSGGSPSTLRHISEIPCLVVAFGIVILSWVLGSEFELLVERDVIVGEVQDVVEEQLISSSINRRLRRTITGKTPELPMRNGLLPGEVGYDGYDLHLFDGVEFESDELDSSMSKSFDVHVDKNKLTPMNRNAGTAEKAISPEGSGYDSEVSTKANPMDGNDKGDADEV